VTTLRLVTTAPAESQPWFDAPAPTALEQRFELEHQRTRILALAVGDHVLPYELRLRVAALDAELATDRVARLSAAGR
jgi:hypothetical protein